MMTKPLFLLPLSRLMLLLAISATQYSAIALPDDNQQPINIQSDSARQQTSEQGEITEYFGNVQMTQGSLKINGEHVVIHSRDRRVTAITATGNPARFEQQSDPARAPVIAKARQLDYTLNDETVVLTTDALIEQPGATFSGERIEYNIGIEQVKARGGNDKSSRVNMVLIPDSKNDQ